MFFLEKQKKLLFEIRKIFWKNTVFEKMFGNFFHLWRLKVSAHKSRTQVGLPKISSLVITSLFFRGGHEQYFSKAKGNKMQLFLLPQKARHKMHNLIFLIFL